MERAKDQKWYGCEERRERVSVQICVRARLCNVYLREQEREREREGEGDRYDCLFTLISDLVDLEPSVPNTGGAQDIQHWVRHHRMLTLQNV